MNDARARETDGGERDGNVETPMMKEKDASWRSQVSRSAWNKEKRTASEPTPSTSGKGHEVVGDLVLAR